MDRHGPPTCPVCWGKECRGGGNKRCVQRDPRPSHLAGILDSYGGLRFVVAHRRSFKHHARHDERLVVVPGLLVHEPIAWGDIPGVIGRIEFEVEKWMKRNERANDPSTREIVALYRLRCLEQNRNSLDLSAIAET